MKLTNCVYCVHCVQIPVIQIDARRGVAWRGLANRSYTLASPHIPTVIITLCLYMCTLSNYLPV